MKTMVEKSNIKSNGYQSDDENIRYKLNTEYFYKINKSSTAKKPEKINYEDDNVRYKFPTILNKPKVESKPKAKSKIKVNFWSNKPTGPRLHNNEVIKERVDRRHTVGIVAENSSLKPKNHRTKVRKRVSFLPAPILSEDHVPMVTVPDDLTIHLNEEEANDLGADLNLPFVNSHSKITNTNKTNLLKHKAKISTTPSSSKGTKRKRSFEEIESRTQGNENELEFFSKYVVQKLRRMETNQRIYSENLINTVLMLGQLGKLSGKSKITDV